MAQDIDWEKGAFSNPKGSEPDWESGEFAEPKKPTRSLADWGKDIATTALKGAIGVPEALVGLADIPTGGAVGKFLENDGGSFGFRPKQAKEFLSDQQSEATKAARQEFQQAEGIGGKAVAALSNPSVIATTVGESLPSMFAGGALAKGIGLAAPALAGRAGLAAAGEGAMMAGSQAESIRQQTADGLLTPAQSALAAGTGVAGGLIGAAGARAAKALGIGDVDTMISNGATQGVAREGMGLASRVGRGALSEGVLEELPQSLVETAFGNVALGKPVTEGMDEAAVLGTLSGGLMGGVAGGLSRPAKPSQQMGIDPGAGPLSRAAASAVDSQPAPQPLGASITGTAPSDLMGRATDPFAAQIMERRQQEAVDATPAQQSEPVPLEQRSLDELRQAFRSAQDPAIRKTLAAEIRKRREAMSDPLAQPSLIPEAAPVEVAPVAQEVQPVTTAQPRQQVGQNPESFTNQNAQMWRDVADRSGLTADIEREFASGKTASQVATALAEKIAFIPKEDRAGFIVGVRATLGIPSMVDEDGQAEFKQWRSQYDARQSQKGTTNAEKAQVDPAVAQTPSGETNSGSVSGSESGTQSEQSGSIDAFEKPNKLKEARNARRTADELRGTTGASTGAGTNIASPSMESAVADVRSGGRNDDAGTAQPDANGVAGGAVGSTAEGSAALRPEGWRTTAIKAGKVARSLGLDPKGKRLKEIVAEIDAVDAGSGVAAKPAAAGYEAAKSIRDAADARVNKASEAMQKYPRGAMGLTPDDVKATPQWKADKAEMDAAMRDLQSANATIAKNFAKEYRAERDAKRAAQANVQNTPQGTAGEAKAPSVEASKAEGGNAAADMGIPTTAGAGDVQADGVKEEANKDAAPAAQAEKPAEDDAFMGVEDQTQTEAFKKWFAGSKVVDDQGRPLRVYHGSPDLRFLKESAVFKSQKERLGFGRAEGAYWFTPSKATAKTYADPRRAFDYQNAEEGVIEVFLKMENPLVIDAGGQNWRDAQKRGKTSDVIEEARKAGHDGVIIRNVKDDYNNGKGTRATDTYAVFESAQIKSATDNRGTFDPANPDITFAGTKDKAKRQGTPVDRAIMDMAGEGRKANEILSFIAKTSKSPYRRQLAQKLLATGANPAVSLGGEMGGGAGFRFLAKYSRKNHEVTLSEAAADRAEQIFLHETTHAATLLALDKGGLIATQMRRLAANVYKDASPEMRKMYGLVLDKRTGEVNVGEFVAEAFTNPQFQKALKGMKADNGSLWDRLVNIVRRILGMEPRQQDALSKALELGAGVMRENMPLRKARSFSVEDGPAFAGTNQTMTEEQAITNGFTMKAYRGVSKANPFNDTDTTWLTTSREVAEAYAEEVMGYDDPGVIEVMVNPSDLPRHDASRLTDEQREQMQADDFGNPQAIGIYDRSDDHPLGGSRRNVTVIHAPMSSVAIIDGDAYMGIDQTETPAFRKWFGDSKVVDSAGKPLRVFHGTGTKFTAFDRSKSSSGLFGTGFYFTDDRNMAEEYANGGQVMEVYLSIKNPAPQKVANEVVDLIGEDDADGIRSELERRGYDGVLMTQYGETLAVAFRPEQIKSATGNNGNFDPEDADIAHFGIADAVEQIKAFDVKEAPKNTWAHYRGMALQALGRRQLVDLYGDEFGPHLKQYDYLVQQMDAEKNETGAEADDIAQRWGKLKDEKALAELMHDATLAKMDPDKPMPTGYSKAEYDKLKTRFNTLSPEAKTLYREARDMYVAHYKAVQQAIKDRIERSEMSPSEKKRMMAQLDDKLFKELQGVYFPLARFGQYVIVVKDANGEVKNVTRAETIKEAEQARKELQKAFPAHMGNTVGKVLKQAEFNAGRDAVGKGFMADLMNALDEKGVDDELRDTVAQLYLSSLPDLSWAKHGIHRKGTPGFSQDARRAFAQNAFHGARYLAKLRYSDRLQDELTGMQEYVKAFEGVEEYDSIQGQQVVDEMVKRHEILMNPKASPVSTALTSFGFLFHMGLSPASAMVNLTQTALVAYPQMGAKWGFTKAGAALTKASEEVVRAKNDLSKALKGDELAAFDRAVKDGTIDVTMAHDLAGIAQGEDQGVMWKIRPVMRWASFMFHHAEKFNRQATFLAAYRLSKETSPGRSEDWHYEEAKKATYDGHYDYSSANRPRLMQGNWQRVILLFKAFAQNTIYTLARNAYLSVKALDPKERAQARKTLAGLMASHAAAAGVLGLPIVGPLLTVASWIGGDDDEPWDAEVAMQNAMAEMIGPKAAEVVARGFSRLTPFDLSGRVALNKLILPDVQEGLEGKEWAESAMAAALGPVAGIGVNVARGAQKITEGDYLRGLEDMMPTALRGPLKALRYANEGAVDKTGIVITDEVSAAGVLGQASGFSPSQVRRDTERRSAIYAYDRALLERRSVLMRMMAEARIQGDEETAAEVQKDIQRFNEKNPTRRITPMNIAQSVRNRRKRIDEAEQGVYLPSKRRDALDAVSF